MEPSPAPVVQALGPQGCWKDGCFFLFTNTSWTSSSGKLEGGGWGRACPSARADESWWAGLREGVRDQGEEPHTPCSPPIN